MDNALTGSSYERAFVEYDSDKEMLHAYEVLFFSIEAS
jgi:hypothetical protein